MKKIIGFSGSPRKQGNTEFLVNKILSGAKEKGAETKLINLSELKVGGCKSCFYCKKNEGCAIKDDMQEIINEIKNADSIIIGSPIYMWQMTSQTKAFVDRLFSFYNSPLSGALNGKKCILAFTHGSPDDSYRSYIDSTSKMLNFLGFKVIGTLAVGNANNGINSNTNILSKAYNLGQSLV